MKTNRLLLLLCVFPLMAADPAGFVVWSAADLKGVEKKLAAKVDGQRFASQQLEKFGNHYTMLAYRQGSGSAELHETEADLFIVESGTAKLLVGGKIVNPKTTAPHEIRGASIQGAEEKALSAGDIVHIPANVPHQLLLTSKEFTYFVLKVQGQ
jgi:mannose-6-phosphate isomerase-like protein (cupin superfamily)